MIRRAARSLGYAALVAVMAWPVACGTRPRPTRLVLITLDTLRYDALFEAPDRPSAMALTLARARGGLSFARFYSATSSTQPSHASLFTGLHPWQHGVSHNGIRLADEHTTVAEVLREAGFSTSAVIGSSPVASRSGFGQGFAAYDDERAERRAAPEGKAQGEIDERFYRLARRVTDLALAQLDRGGSGKQFCWFHYFDPHAPYGDSGPGPHLRPQDMLRQRRDGVDISDQVARARQLYDKDVGDLDQHLERLFERLDRDTATYDTHVVVTADHGESFGEDGSLAHGRRLTPGQIHVPFFVLSSRVKPGVRDDIGGSIDVPATLYALAGVRAQAPGGRNLLVPSESATAFGMRRSFSETEREVRLDGRAYRLDFNLFYAIGDDGRIHVGNAGKILPEEGSGEPGGAARPLQILFESFERQLAGSEGPRDTDPEVQEALRALGYVG